MRVVIDISEHDKEWISNAYGIPQEINTKIAEVIINAEPCQLEPHWIPFEKRQLTDEEKIDHPDWEYILDGEYPEDGQEVLITNGLWVTQDTFFCDGECYFDGGIDVEDVIAWMPLPEPYKGVTE